MATLWDFPIEPLEERYSEQWGRWLPQEYERQLIPYRTITGMRLGGMNIRDGQFLDVCDTNCWKAAQLADIAAHFYRGNVEDGDTFFFHDGWFPGVEMLRYMQHGLGIKDLRIVGFFHAGTYDPHDFLAQRGLEPVMMDAERGWMKLYDAILVGSKWHKELLCETRGADPDKIIVTPYPCDPTDFEGYRQLAKSKNRLLVFPHRLAPEKQPDLFDSLAKGWQADFPGWQFIKTKDVCQTKSEYYEMLAKAAISVSLAKQETFGIAMMESWLLGAIPLVPDRLSYTDWYPHQLQYADIDELDANVRLTIGKIEKLAAETIAEDPAGWCTQRALGRACGLLSTAYGPCPWSKGQDVIRNMVSSIMRRSNT